MADAGCRETAAEEPGALTQSSHDDGRDDRRVVPDFSSTRLLKKTVGRQFGFHAREAGAALLGRHGLRRGGVASGQSHLNLQSFAEVSRSKGLDNRSRVRYRSHGDAPRPDRTQLKCGLRRFEPPIGREIPRNP